MEKLTGVLILVFVVAALFYYSDNQKKKETTTVNKEMVPLASKATGASNDRMQKRVNDVNDLTGWDSYGEVVKYMGVEREVMNSHDEYSNEINREAMGPSTLSERDDDQGPVPWVGLRRTNYHDIYAAADARQVPTESPDQLTGRRPYIF